MSLLTIAEMATNYGGVDVAEHDADNIQMAIDLAEFDIEESLKTFLTPTQMIEEYPWPIADGRLTLDYRRVTALDTVTAKHSLDADCVWLEDDECGVILDANNSLVFISSTNLTLGNCNCDAGIAPDRAEITYTSGYTTAETATTTRVGKALRQGITLRAREWMQALKETDYWQGEHAIVSWNSMDYSERREYGDKILNPLGPGPLSQAAWRLVERLMEKPAIMLRSSHRV